MNAIERAREWVNQDAHTGIIDNRIKVPMTIITDLLSVIETADAAHQISSENDAMVIKSLYEDIAKLKQQIKELSNDKGIL
jgi:molecular chaperone GrpE (heat shock protein)